MYLFTFWSWRPHGTLRSLMALGRWLCKITHQIQKSMTALSKMWCSPRLLVIVMYLPHTRVDQCLLVDPFDQALPKINKYCIYSHTICNSECLYSILTWWEEVIYIITIPLYHVPNGSSGPLLPNKTWWSNLPHRSSLPKMALLTFGTLNMHVG